MVIWLLTALAWAGGVPTVDVTWKKTDATLQVQGPPGEHVAPDATASADLRWGDRALTWTSDGAALAEGIPVPGARGHALEGSLRLSLCEDGGTLCRLVDVEVAGEVPDARRGRAALVVSEPGRQPAEASPYRQDADRAVQAAFARAAERDVPVLLDFTAVWCPPCNLLAAEVLHDAEHADLLAGFELVQVDVDDPSSWAAKSRYAVGGYPTVVAARADGEEIDRIEGYPGEGPFVAWLDGVIDPAGAEERGVGEQAWAALSRGDAERARALLDTVDEPDGLEYRLVRVNLEPTVADARWLSRNAPGRAIDWVYAARDLGETDAGKAVLVTAIQNDLRTVEPATASDLLYVRGLLEREPHARTWYAAALAALRGAFTGDPDHDRAYWTWAATLQAESGDLDGAIAFLEQARDTFPDEPTWALTAARLLLEGDRPQRALSWTEQGLAEAWGDNRLRLATLHVQALQALDRGDEARAFGDEVLASLPEPGEGIEVRTPRYRQALREALEPAAP